MGAYARRRDNDGDDGVAQDGGHTAANRLQKHRALVLASGPPCYDQLTPVKTEYPLTINLKLVFS